MRPRTSKPVVGLLGDVDGRIVPVAPPPVSNLTLTSRPMLSTASSRSFGLRPRMKTKAPSSTNSLAVASPVPEVPPVITATLSCSFSLIDLPPRSPIARYTDCCTDDLPRLADSRMATKRPVRTESVSCDRSRQAESCQHAALKCRDCADPLAGQCHHDQGERVGDATYGAEEIDAECRFSVRARRDEPEASALAKRRCRKPPFGLLTLVFERTRWHAQPRVVRK